MGPIRPGKAAYSVLLLAAGIAAESRAQSNLAPPPFVEPHSGAKAVFVDFQDAVYNITYDIPNRETRVQATIHFVAPEAGMPVLDSRGSATKTLLDDADAKVTQATPATDTAAVKVVQTVVEAGDHTLVLEFKMSGQNAPTYANGTVQSGFFTNDDDGIYLQSYLPANYEFDQFRITFNVEILGLTGEQALYANGTVAMVDANHWTITYPDYFNSSAMFFHTLPKSMVSELRFTVDNGSGTQIPAVVYEKTGAGLDLDSYRDIAISSIGDLTARFGPFAHPSLTIYAQGSGGGMEYDGATVSDDWALPHELAHSYFGRAVMPANGNAGWIDEAMATLTEGPYRPDSSNIQATNMSNHSVYYTSNDGNGYGQGMNLLAHFGEEFHAANAALSIDGFVRNWYQARRYTTVNIQNLQDDLEAYSGMSLATEFGTYVFGRSLTGARAALVPPGRPLHRKLTGAEFMQLQ